MKRDFGSLASDDEADPDEPQSDSSGPLSQPTKEQFSRGDPSSSSPPCSEVKTRARASSLSMTEEEKLEKNRKRNREHAKKTRMRKKEMIEFMKKRITELQKESADLEQRLEEKNTANILLQLGDRGGPNVDKEELSEVAERKAFRAAVPCGNIIDQLRQKVRVEALSVMKECPGISSKSMTESSSSSSSCGSGQNQSGPVEMAIDDYSDEEDVREHDLKNDSKSSKTSSDNYSDERDLDKIRRERNRMHAKLTRDRRKLFTQEMQQTIEALERHINFLRNQLTKQSSADNGCAPNDSPENNAGNLTFAAVNPTTWLTQFHSALMMESKNKLTCDPEKLEPKQ